MGYSLVSLALPPPASKKMDLETVWVCTHTGKAYRHNFSTSATEVLLYLGTWHVLAE